MHVLYNQSDFTKMSLIVSLISKKLYEVTYTWLSNDYIEIRYVKTDIIMELGQAEYSGKFRRAYKNEGLIDE